MTENTEVKGPRAGNTVDSLKPKEVFANLPAVQEALNDLGDWAKKAPQPSLICPDIDECAPVLNAGQNSSSNVNKAEEEQPYLPMKYAHVCGHGHGAEPAPQIPEEIPPTNLWSLRWRINELEKRVDELTDRIALFNVRSGQKL